MRPIYQSANDLKNEDVVAAQAAEVWGMEECKIPNPLYRIDRAFMLGGKVRCLAEVKCRTCPMNAYKTYMLGAQKYGSMVMAANFLGMPVKLIVRWGCGTVGALTVPFRFDVRVGGRNDRGDSKDTELTIHTPIEDFELIACRI
tara:strand:+ start:106 stop:537 length:432 start_codon:yes stop_codon:yes gene_type:complete